MTDEKAFIAAILADPDDDAPRLIYADWLDEQGHCERAEFIRVQCRLAPILEPHPCGHNAGAGTCWVCRLRCREQELLAWGPHVFLGAIEGLATFVAAWPDDMGWLSKRAGENATAIRATFRRGFVHAITCSAESWMGFADAILAAQPVQEVTLMTAPGLWCVVGGPGFHWSLAQSESEHFVESAVSVGEASPAGRWEASLELMQLEFPRINFTLSRMEGLNPDAPTMAQDTSSRLPRPTLSDFMNPFSLW